MTPQATSYEVAAIATSTYDVRQGSGPLPDSRPDHVVDQEGQRVGSDTGSRRSLDRLAGHDDLEVVGGQHLQQLAAEVGHEEGGRGVRLDQPPAVAVAAVAGEV